MDNDGAAASTDSEPPVGSTVKDDCGHEWRRSDDGWTGCYNCEPDAPAGWSWDLILADTRGCTLTIRAD